jgi:hypothetical protein
MTKQIVSRALALALAAAITATVTCASAAPVTKNWTAPAHKIYAQHLSDEIMAQHPELWSVTFHGVPPGMDKVYTMFAGSYPERIGNPDDPDDVDVIVKGISSVDPRWHRHDAKAKFVLQIPLRDKAGENIGLLVLAYKITPPYLKDERGYFDAGTRLRDHLQAAIPSYAALFAPAS